MTEKVFIDTDIALDLLARREPYYSFAAALFTHADKVDLKLFISALTFANLNYLLNRQHSGPESRRILKTFKVLVEVLEGNDKIIELALNSRFTDFEDAIQYYSAIGSELPTLLTRNLRDYKHVSIRVTTPEIYLKTFQAR